MKNFQENSSDLVRVICAISDYYIALTLANLNPDEKFRSVQVDLMLPLFKSYRRDAEKYHSEGKIKKLQALYTHIEREATGNYLLEDYVLDKTGIELGMMERQNQKLRKIIERGKLKNENEYHLIAEQINLLSQVKKRDEQMITALNKLLIDFEKKFA